MREGGHKAGHEGGKEVMREGGHEGGKEVTREGGHETPPKRSADPRQKTKLNGGRPAECPNRRTAFRIPSIGSIAQGVIR